MSGRLSEGTRRDADLGVPRAAFRVPRGSDHQRAFGWLRYGLPRWLGVRLDFESRLLRTAAIDGHGKASLPAYVALALIVIVPTAAIAVRRGFDGLYGQDAYAYYDYAVHSVRQSILQREPLGPFFWPPGYPLLVAVSSFAFGQAPLAGQLVSLLMGAAVPVLTALLVRELLPREPWLALLAGLLAAVPGQLWQSSMVVMADTTGLALATFAAFALARYARAHAWQWLVAASAAIACATLTRWIYGLVTIPFAAFAVMCLLGSPLGTRRAFGHAAAAVVVGAAILLPLLGGPVLDVFTRPDDPAAFAGNLQVYSWSPLNAFKTEFFTADGHLAYALPNGLYYLSAPANLAYFGPLIAPWAVLGVWRAVRQWPARTTVLIVGWVAVVFAFHAGAPWQNFRFALAFLPPLAILAAGGLTAALAFASAARDRRMGLVGIAAGVCAVSVLVIVGSGVRLLQGFVDRKNDELALVRWVQSQASSPETQVFSFGPTLAFRQYSAMPTFDLFDLSSAEIASELADGKDSYVLVDEGNIAAQWAAEGPGRNLQALRDGGRLTSLGTLGTYTLYRVER